MYKLFLLDALLFAQPDSFAELLLLLFSLHRASLRADFCAGVVVHVHAPVNTGSTRGPASRVRRIGKP